MEEAVGEKRKAFVAARRSNDNRQAYVSASRHASSVIAKAKAKAKVWQATCLSPSFLNLCILFSVLLLVLLPHLPLLQTFSNVLLPGCRHRSSATTRGLAFLSPSERLRTLGSEATCPSSPNYTP